MYVQSSVTGNVDRQEIGSRGPKIPGNLVPRTKFSIEAATKYCPRLGKLPIKKKALLLHNGECVLRSADGCPRKGKLVVQTSL